LENISKSPRRSQRTNSSRVKLTEWFLKERAIQRKEDVSITCSLTTHVTLTCYDIIIITVDTPFTTLQVSICFLRHHHHVIHYITSFHLFPTTSSSRHSLHHKFPFVSYDIVVTSFVMTWLRKILFSFSRNPVFILMISYTLLHDIMTSQNPVFILTKSCFHSHDIIHSLTWYHNFAKSCFVFSKSCYHFVRSMLSIKDPASFPYSRLFFPQTFTSVHTHL
jgi:hypothetical protein